ncbi:hypothetical protein [Stackebrandtia soli]|uniref:hypothetical protein n=1 Tax=Stackebrandtia soli TaxID=1892856 RepID=UPI0039ED9A71
MTHSKLRHMPPALYACAAVAVPLAIAGGVWRGTAGLLGALAGVALTATGFAASWYFVVWTEPLGLRLVLPAGLMGLVAKIILFAGAFLAATRAEWSGMMPMAVGSVVSIVAVLVALMVWASRVRLPYVQPVDDIQ